LDEIGKKPIDEPCPHRPIIERRVPGLTGLGQEMIKDFVDQRPIKDKAERFGLARRFAEADAQTLQDALDLGVIHFVRRPTEESLQISRR
jgi:hypothetical protein